MSLLRNVTAFGLGAERAITRGIVRLSRTWPSGGNKRPARILPDWPDHFIGFMLQQTSRELSHVNAFFSVGIVKAGVNLLQQDLGSITIRAYRGRAKSEVEIERTGKMTDVGGNIADLLHYANPEQTGRQLREAVFGSMILNGNGYLMMEGAGPDPGANKPPLYLREMPGQLTRPVPGRGRRVMGYEFQSGGEGAWEPIDTDNVIPFRRYTPLDRPAGVSDIEAVKNDYEAEYFALLWMKELFRHGGVYPGIWATDETSSVRYTDDQLVDIANRMVARHAGVTDGKVFLPLIVQGLKYIANGPKPSEIEVEKKLGVIDSKIILAMGIPPWRMGIQEGGALSEGSKTDVALYFLSKIEGEIGGMIDILNERLCPRFGRDVHLKADITEHPMVQQILIEQAVNLQKLAGGKPVWTQNEVRVATRKPEVSEEGSDSIAPLPIASPFGQPGGDAKPPAEEPSPPPKPKRTSQRLQLASGEERENLRRRAGFRLETYRARMEALLLERVAEQRAIARERLRAAWDASDGRLRVQRGRAVRLALEISGLMDDPSPEDERRAAKLLEQLLRVRAIDALQDLEEAAGVALEVQIDITASNWAEFIRQQVDRAIRMPDGTTRGLLRESIAEGIELHEGLAELIGRIDQVFEGRRNNVATIARTETQPAYNFAAMESWKQSGIVERHEWLTSRSGLGGRHSEDPEGRYSASDGGRGLDGQVRAIGETFDVGGVPMLYPGDPAGPPGETINCVCTLIPVVDEQQLRWRRVGNRFAGSHGNGNGKPSNRIGEYLYAGRK